jgi:HAD superfamily hydrolase (TIGR01493 family)
MALADRRIMTFDVVGTLIDFEAGILGCLRGIVDPAGKDLPDLTLLAAFARAEDAQQHVSPATPFTQMLNPIYERMATEFGLPRGNGEADRLAASMPEWPAFTDATDGLARLRARYRLVALTNADNWALEHMSRTLGDPFDDRVTAEDVGATSPTRRSLRTAAVAKASTATPSRTSSTSRKASTTTSALQSASASRSAGSSAGGASRAWARRHRRRPSSPPTTTSPALPSSSRPSRRSPDGIAPVRVC